MYKFIEHPTTGHEAILLDSSMIFINCLRQYNEIQALLSMYQCSLGREGFRVLCSLCNTVVPLSRDHLKNRSQKGWSHIEGT